MNKGIPRIYKENNKLSNLEVIKPYHSAGRDSLPDIGLLQAPSQRLVNKNQEECQYIKHNPLSKNNLSKI